MVQFQTPGMKAATPDPELSVAWDHGSAAGCELSLRERWMLSVTILMASTMISIGERLPVRTCKSAVIHKAGRRTATEAAMPPR